MPKIPLTLPDFLIVGANKGGTTSVASYLNQHPDVKISDIKEPMYFTSDPLVASATREEANLARPFFALDLASYSELFQGWKKDAAVFGEASTSYLCNPLVAAPSIRKTVPDVKLIAILRDPVERAFSAYRMAYGNGIETRAFADVVGEAESCRRILPRHGVREYIRNGLYGQQLDIFMRYFTREQFLILKYDELCSDPTEVMRTISEFIGVERFAYNVTIKLNIASDHGVESLIMTRIQEQILRDFYEDDIRKTETITGLDLSSWYGLTTRTV